MHNNFLRTEVRFPTDASATMQILGQTCVALTVRVCDVSKSGLRIRLGTKVEEGTRVHIFLNDSLISAEARNCSELAFDLYEAGFRISDVLWPAVETGGADMGSHTAAGHAHPPLSNSDDF